LPLIGGKKQVARAAAITGAKTRDAIKVTAGSLSNAALNPIFSLSKNDTANRRLA